MDARKIKISGIAKKSTYPENKNKKDHGST